MTSLRYEVADRRKAAAADFWLRWEVLLLIFLTYPLGLGVWLGFTDTKIGRGGAWIGIGPRALVM